MKLPEFDMLTVKVAAKSRRLGAQWGMEIESSLYRVDAPVVDQEYWPKWAVPMICTRMGPKSHFGLDAEQELVSILEAEILNALQSNKPVPIPPSDQEQQHKAKLCTRIEKWCEEQEINWRFSSSPDRYIFDNQVDATLVYMRFNGEDIAA